MPFPGCGDIVTNTYHALVELGEQATLEDQQLIVKVAVAKTSSSLFRRAGLEDTSP